MAVQPAPVRRRTVAVIYNPTAGWRRQRRLRRVLDALEARDCRVVLLRTQAPQHATELARGIGAVEAVVVAGGDGTINEVVNGLTPDAPPLGLIPLGTANVFAMELGVARRAAAIADTIVGGEEHAVSVGSVNGRLFVQMAGVGADAHVVDQVSKRIKKVLGKGAYVWSALVSLFNYRFPHFEIEVDGAPLTASSVIVSNGHFYGGRNVVAPKASLMTDSLEVCVMTRFGRFNALRYGLGVFLDALPRMKGVRYLTARRIKVLSPAGLPVQGDGDILATNPAEIVVKPGALRVLVPSAR